MKGEEVMEWKTQRYEGSVGVDGRWVVSRSEAEARAEAAERDLRELEADVEQTYVPRADLEAAERERDEWKAKAEMMRDYADSADRDQARDKATLAAVREALLPFAKQADRYDEPGVDGEPWEDDHYPIDQDFTVGDFRRARGAILDGEGEK